MTTTAVTAVTGEVLQAEQELRRALTAKDDQALKAILDDDLLYVHSGDGKTQGKADYMAGIQVSQYRPQERGALTVRMFGDIAIVTGTMVNVRRESTGAPGEVARIELMMTQVWVRRGRWKLVSAHSCRVPAAAG